MATGISDGQRAAQEAISKVLFRDGALAAWTRSEALQALLAVYSIVSVIGLTEEITPAANEMGARLTKECNRVRNELIKRAGVTLN